MFSNAYIDPSESEERVVYKRYNIVTNGHDSVLETIGVTFNCEQVIINSVEKNIYTRLLRDYSSKGLICSLCQYILVCPPNKQWYIICDHGPALKQH